VQKQNNVGKQDKVLKVRLNGEKLVQSQNLCILLLQKMDNVQGMHVCDACIQIRNTYGRRGID